MTGLVYDKGLTGKTSIRIETKSGIKVMKINLDPEGNVESVTVDMGAPADIAPMRVEKFQDVFVSMGNPHFVTFVEDVEQVALTTYGPRLEKANCFPDGCNIEFAELNPDGTIRMRVWERGSSITLACGTGACATAVAAHFLSLAPATTKVEMDGGTLGIIWDRAADCVFMTGPAEITFEGKIKGNVKC